MIKTTWTIDAIPDLTGKVILVTGSNSGLGYESIKVFSAKGADTIMACRNPQKADAAIQAIKKENPGAKVIAIELDLSDRKSIHACARQFQEKYGRLDILMNNAGIMAVPFAKTTDGFESQTGVNHLGHFALTGLLLPLLLKTPGSRVVTISSSMHLIGKIRLDDLMFEKPGSYTPIKAYAQSKLANLLFTYRLNDLYKTAGMDTIALAAHPGAAHTSLTRYMEKYWYLKYFKGIFEMTLQSASDGALPGIRAACDPYVNGGEYYGPSGLFNLKGDPVLVKSSALSYNRELAEKLWEKSEALTGIAYNLLKKTAR